MSVGTKVRIIEIADSVIRDLPTDEQRDLESMIGEVFEVYEIDERGAAWVEKIWYEHDGQRSHDLALDPHEMEVI